MNAPSDMRRTVATRNLYAAIGVLVGAFTHERNGWAGVVCASLVWVVLAFTWRDR
jgi:hypothetical protein